MVQVGMGDEQRVQGRRPQPSPVHIAHRIGVAVDVQFRDEPHPQIIMQTPGGTRGDEALVVTAHLAEVGAEIEQHPFPIDLQMDLVTADATRPVVDR